MWHCIQGGQVKSDPKISWEHTREERTNIGIHMGIGTCDQGIGIGNIRTWDWNLQSNCRQNVNRSTQ